MNLKAKDRLRLYMPSWYLWLIPLALALALRVGLKDRPDLVEQYHARKVFTWLSVPLGQLVSLLPFSLTEAALVLLVLALAGFVLRFALQLIFSSGRLARILRLLRNILWLASLGLLLFMLLHGLNYARQPLGVNLDLPVQERSVAELEDLSKWLVEKTNSLRLEVAEDESGVFVLRDGAKKTLARAPQLYQEAAEKYPLLAGPTVTPKSVFLSRYWSYTGITGMYMPFFVEANVNTDAPHYGIPEAALHEIAHTKGFAREDEASFLAFLTGISSKDPEFSYSAALGATLHSLNALAAVDQPAWQEVAGGLSDAVWRDLSAGSAYWQQFAGPVQETSTKVNEAFLQANLQADGVRSYGRMVDLVLAWYASTGGRP
jgi:branched-subunit amino acid transport protein AzlD